MHDYIQSTQETKGVSVYREQSSELEPAKKYHLNLLGINLNHVMGKCFFRPLGHTVHQKLEGSYGCPSQGSNWGTTLQGDVSQEYGPKQENLAQPH